MAVLTELSQRNTELYAAYLKSLRQPRTSHASAVRMAINTPCSRYWVSFESFYKRLRQRINPDAHYTRVGSPYRSSMVDLYQHIFDTYDQLCASPAFEGCSTFFILNYIFNMPAPRFYISEHQASRIIEQMKQQFRESRTFTTYIK